ncbi:MAG: glycosyltransferase family 2 protein [Patescibacteria group bacterium]|jgi:glycosyltransferase involved in cell wall biosynthesis
MENKPLVSVITTSFNSEKTIRQTIESVLHQTYSNIEYIIIDGKSSDHTIDIVREYEPKFNGRMRVISEKDDGIYFALNKGLGVAKGELVSFANSDDWYELNAVEQAVRVHQKDPEAFIYGILRYIQDGKVLQISTGSHEFLPGALIPYPTWFVPMYLFKKHGLFETKYRIGSDVDLVLRYFKNGVKFYRIDSILSNFRTGGESDKHVNLSRIEVLKSMCELGYISKNKLLYNVTLLKLTTIKERMFNKIRSFVVKIVKYD